MLLSGTRLINVSIGIVAIPALLHFLKNETFAAWALLYALSFGFAMLDIGVPGSVRRFLASPYAVRDWKASERFLVGAIAWPMATFTLAAPFIVASSAWFSRLLHLPDTPLLDSAGLLIFVFCAVAAQSILQVGIFGLYATGKFHLVARIGVLQPFLAVSAALVAAACTSRLDVSLLSFWTVQVGASFMTFQVMRRHYPVKLLRSRVDFESVRRMLKYGLSVQTSRLAEFGNYQFDKFVLAALVGLQAVSAYEVANRAVLALRSIPVSGLDTYLPAAAVVHAEASNLWLRYLALTRFAGYGAVAFLVAPMAVAPVGLYAWTGGTGDLGKWVFMFLATGATLSVLASPAATILQATGNAKTLAIAAAISTLINIPLSLILTQWYGLEGAACGTAFAIAVNSSILVRSVHRLSGESPLVTLKVLLDLWPFLLICGVWGGIAYALYIDWILALDPMVRYSRYSRIVPGMITICAFATLLMVLVLTYWLQPTRRLRDGHWLRALSNEEARASSFGKL